MQELIETIRAAVASGASKEQKAAGAAACRTIFAALDTEPGTPFAIPGAPVQAMPRVSIDQVLDLMIARLTTIASEREAKPALAAPGATEPATSALAAAPPTTSTPPESRGLRIPMASTGALKLAARPANTTRPATRRKP